MAPPILYVPLVIGVEANVTIETVDVYGRVLTRERRKNLVTLSGRNLIRDFLNASAPAPPSHFAVGTGANAVNANDATLQTEVFRDVITKRTATAGVLQFKYYLPSTAANGNTLREAGIFCAASAGTMLARVAYTGISKTSAIAITYTWDLTISAIAG